ncbi:MAG: 5-methylthioadenosine/S-adenosylhomocysteine deaminase [Gammaproteobacteria bacterium]|nr:5-methylthioadenosine/S-adenosylhomocysteine deaminase [Gammaproteobacteria bacterium]
MYTGAMSARTVDLIVTGRWVVPVEPEGVVLEHHAVVMDAGRIAAVLPAAEALRNYAAREVIPCDRHALIPGLVNTHTHAAMSLMRGYADDLPLMQWLQDHIWPAEQKWVSPEFVRDGTLLAAAEMLAGGTTCFGDMFFFPDDVARAAVTAGIRAVVGMIVIEFPSAYASDCDDYLRKGIDFHDHYRDHPLVRTALAPHAPYTVSDEALGRIVTYAAELNVPVHMHVHETEAEVRESVARTGVRPLARLERLGLLSPQLMAVHMTQIEQHEIAMLAAQGVHVLHCPESNMKLASGFCPVARLAAAGVNVALGTDGAASNNDLDMFGEMRSAALLAKAVAGDASAVPAAAALRMATLNGARALGMEELLGSLVPGKAADVVAVDLGGIATQPIYNPISHLVYATGRHQVTDVWVAGRHLLRGGALLTVDEIDLAQRASQWQDRLSAR